MKKGILFIVVLALISAVSFAIFSTDTKSPDDVRPAVIPTINILTPSPTPQSKTEVMDTPTTEPKIEETPEIQPTQEASPEPEQSVAPSPSATPNEPSPSPTPEPEISATPVEEDKNMYCSLLVSCAMLADNPSLLEPDKRSLIPDDGIIFSSDEVVFYEGESVFNILSRELKKNKIHLEFVETPAYDSMYIEGISNLYQFDAGELSGWIYRVNGKTPSVGCSLYELKPGDRVEFLYTCDLGNDL